MKNLPFILILFLFVGCKKTEQSKKTLIDFFQPIQNLTPLVSSGTWGGDNVLPRDTTDGLEDATLKMWCYWDGSIVKSDDGKYHMYASRWSQKFSHGEGWHLGSKGIHAVSDNLLGPYHDMGEAWPQWKQGKGHNVVGLRMKDGRYAMITSEITSGQVFVSDNPSGPFKLLGNLKIDPNGFYPGWGRYDELDDGALKGGSLGHLSNVMIMLRPDGRYMLVARHCVTMISDNGILGPYKMMSKRAWEGIKGLPQCKMEDPTVWYSDGMYHMVVNYHGADSTFHLTSADGIDNWKNRGLAYHRSRKVMRHKDGTVEDWYEVQRPTVYVEDNEVKAFNFSVIDVSKGGDRGDDNHGCKVMVIPFDGKAFGKHIRDVVNKEDKKNDATAPPAPWNSVDIGSGKSGNTGFDSVVNTIRVKASGNSLNSKKDAFRYVYQKMNGDISAKTKVLSYDVTKGNANSGIMIRKSLDDNSPFVFLSLDKIKGLSVTQRLVKGEEAKVIKTSNIKAPYWIRLEKRKKVLTCYASSSNRLNWTELAELKMNIKGDYYAGLTATSLNTKELSFVRFKDVDFHRYGFPKVEGIISHTFPDSISESGIVKFDVEMESYQTLDVWVELQNVQTLKKYKVLRKRFWKNGIQHLTYDAGEKLDPKSTYWFVIKAVPMHFHDSERIQSAFKKVFVKQ